MPPGDYPDWTDLVHIIGTDIMVAIDVQGAYIMMPVDIQAQYVNVEIDIVAQTLEQLNINIAASAVTLDINLKTSDITLNINIAASAVTLDINLKASDITLNIDIEAQSVGVYLRPEWACLQGEDKNWSGSASVNAGASSKIVDYTVPTGKTLYIVSMSFGVETAEGGIFANVNIAGTTVIRTGGHTGGAISFPAPYVVSADEKLEGYVTNVLGTQETLGMTIRGYEL